jgi:hypothetical protein
VFDDAGIALPKLALQKGDVLSGRLRALYFCEIYILHGRMNLANKVNFEVDYISC